MSDVNLYYHKFTYTAEYLGKSLLTMCFIQSRLDFLGDMLRNLENAKEFAFHFVRFACEVIQESEDDFIASKPMIKSLRLCIEYIPYAYFDLDFQSCSLAMNHFFAEEFIRYASDADYQKWHDLILHWMKKKGFFGTALFSLYASKYGISLEIEQNLRARFPSSATMCIIALYYQPELSCLRQLNVKQASLPNNMVSNLIQFLTSASPSNNDVTQAFTSILATVADNDPKFDPLLSKGIRAITMQNVDLVKSRFADFVCFAEVQHSSMHTWLAETIILIHRSCTPHEWLLLCMKLNVYQHKFVSDMLNFLSIFCHVMPNSFVDIWFA